MDDETVRELEARIAELDRRIEGTSAQLEKTEMLKTCRGISIVEFVVQTTALQIEREYLMAERDVCLELLACNRAGNACDPAKPEQWRQIK